MSEGFASQDFDLSKGAGITMLDSGNKASLNQDDYCLSNDDKC